MEQTSGKRYRNYGYAKPRKCGKCESTYFTKVSYNQFKDESSDLLNGDREIDPDHKATLLKCLGCDNLELPSITYGYASGLELEIANDVSKILEKRKAKV
jgi:hypothetical protein